MSSGAQTLPRSRTRLTARAAILAALVTVIAFMSIVPLRQFLEQQARIGELEVEAHRLELANRKLAEEVDRLHDDAYLERLARECLGVVRPGHTAFVTVPSEGEALPSPC